MKFNSNRERNIFSIVMIIICLIILGAPLPLTEKRKLLELLNTPDSDGYADVSKCIREFDDALAALELKNSEIY